MVRWSHAKLEDARRNLAQAVMASTVVHIALYLFAEITVQVRHMIAKVQVLLRLSAWNAKSPSKTVATITVANIALAQHVSTWNARLNY